jgi:hypothetical protein
MLCHSFPGTKYADLLADAAENNEKIEAASKHIVILDEESWKV